MAQLDAKAAAAPDNKPLIDALVEALKDPLPSAEEPLKDRFYLPLTCAAAAAVEDYIAAATASGPLAQYPGIAGSAGRAHFRGDRRRRGR